MQRHRTARLPQRNLLTCAAHVPCSDGTWTYKIPSAGCIPRQFNVTFLKVGFTPVSSVQVPRKRRNCRVLTADEWS